MIVSDNLRGIALMVLGMFGFAVTDTFLKLLGKEFPSGQIMISLGLGGGTIFAILAFREGSAGWSTAFRHPLVLLRNIFEMLGTVGFLTGLVLAPLSIVSAIVQAAPLIVTLGAAIWLKEKVGPHRWTAIFLGLFGVLLVIKPWSSAFEPGSLFAVCGVVFLSLRDLVTRRVPKDIATMKLAAYAMYLLVPAGIVTLLITDQELVSPNTNQILFLAAAILISTIGYFGTTAAMRVGDASLVSAFRYSRILFALVLAAAVFGERPDAFTYIGAAIIVLSGLYAMWRERLRKKA